jgi:hypothetical protein
MYIKDGFYHRIVNIGKTDRDEVLQFIEDAIDEKLQREE